MPRLYTPEERKEVLTTLRIRPKGGKLSGKEAALVLTWRAKEEFGVEHEYKPSILRRHVEQGNLKAYPATKLTGEGKSRKNVYDVEAVFALEIEPNRGLKVIKQQSSKEREQATDYSES